jgi:hypothetical protein
MPSVHSSCTPRDIECAVQPVGAGHRSFTPLGGLAGRRCGLPVRPLTTTTQRWPRKTWQRRLHSAAPGRGGLASGTVATSTSICSAKYARVRSGSAVMPTQPREHVSMPIARVPLTITASRSPSAPGPHTAHPLGWIGRHTSKPFADLACPAAHSNDQSGHDTDALRRPICRSWLVATTRF